jgi:hypothetical protein
MEFTTENEKAKVVINCATIADVKALKKALLVELQKYNTGLKIESNGADLLNRNIDVTGLLDFAKNVLIGIDISDEIETALIPCLKICTWNNFKITPTLFDEHPEARNDIYEIYYACMEANLRPFFKSLTTLCKTGKFQTVLSLISSLNATT